MSRVAQKNRSAARSKGIFHVSGHTIVGPNGAPFVGIGANVGTTSAFDWKGVCQGHSADAEAWGWNIVRLNILATGVISWSYVASSGYAALMNLIDSIVSEYTGRKIVVMIASHDLLMNGSGEQGIAVVYFQQISDFWADMASRYKANPYVWFNIHNEPPVEDQMWVDVHDAIIGRIRQAGATNIVVVDAPVWGQDLGPYNNPQYRLASHPTMAPFLQQKHHNIVLAQHNYGGYDAYATDAKLITYIVIASMQQACHWCLANLVTPTMVRRLLVRTY